MKFPIVLGDNSLSRVNKVSNISGWQQRGILGATAVVQPIIDYNNKDADEDTRKYGS